MVSTACQMESIGDRSQPINAQSPLTTAELACCETSDEMLRGEGGRDSYQTRQIGTASSSSWTSYVREQGQGPTASSSAACLAHSTPVAGITASQRANAVDSMIAAAVSLRLGNDALFLAVACLDKYIAAVPTSCDLLQPISIACLWIAAKYEAAAAPPVAAFASLAVFPPFVALNTTAPASSLLAFLEATILQELDYRLASFETTKKYKHIIMQDMEASGLTQQQLQQLYSMTSYLTEVTLLEHQLLPCPPRQLAAGSYALAHILLGLPLDHKLFHETTGYTFEELHTVLQYLCALHTTLWRALADGKPYSISVKYCSAALHCVAQVTPLVDPRDPRLVF